MTLTDRIDITLDTLKWPVALATLVVLPGALSSTLGLARTVLGDPTPLGAFCTGLAVYFLLWWTLLRRPMFGSYFSTLEHELTHALFAAATGHRVVGLRSTWKRGGRITFVGRGNWLITLAPYFFPTACVAVLLLALIAPQGLRFWIDAALGATVGYHVTSTWRERHLGQTDVQKAGYVFSLVFLPTANLLALGVIIAFAHGGVRAASDFVRASVAWFW